MAQAPRDQNRVPTLLGTSNADGVTPVTIYADPVTHRLLIDAAGGGTGTVTDVSVVTANGFAGTVADPTTTPAITLSTTVTGIVKGNGTALSAAVAGTDYTSLAFKTIAVSGQSDVVADSPEDTLTLAAGTGITITTNAGTDTVTITATGVAGSIVVGTTTITSGANTRILYDNNGTLGEYTITGSGTVVAMQTSPVFTTPNIGVATATSVNGLTITTSTGTLTIANGKTLTANASTTFAGTDGKTLTISNSGTLAGGDAFVLAIAAGKTLTVSNSITLAGTDSTVMTFPTTSATIARTDAGQTFTGVQVFTSPSITTANLTGTQLLTENASIGLDPAGSADGKYTGITVTATAGYTQAFGDLVYLAVADSRWELADADAAATAGPVALAMVVVAGTDGNPCTLLLQGIIRADAKFPTMTVGATQYVGETAGAIQGSIPTGADNIIRTVGYALTADELYFNPSTDWQVTVA